MISLLTKRERAEKGPVSGDSICRNRRGREREREREIGGDSSFKGTLLSAMHTAMKQGVTLSRT